MPFSLPTQADANVGSQNTISADITAAQVVFMASTTVLINNAVSNGFFKVEPFLIPFVSPTFVISTFEALGYTVLFPIWPFFGDGNWGYQPCFAPPGFPEVLGNDWHNWSCHCGCNCGPPRIRISWGVFPAESFLLLESGNVLELMASPGGLLLE